VLEYLSDEWVAALDEALAAIPSRRGPNAETGPAGRLVIRQTVTGGRNGDRSYTVWFEGGRAGAGGQAPDGGDPDVTFTCDWDTAVAIATGKERAQTAFLGGRLRLGGDSRALLAHAGALAALDDVSAGVRARTDHSG
jgi:putative sterol carrier protein